MTMPGRSLFLFLVFVAKERYRWWRMHIWAAVVEGWQWISSVLLLGVFWRFLLRCCCCCCCYNQRQARFTVAMRLVVGGHCCVCVCACVGKFLGSFCLWFVGCVVSAPFSTQTPLPYRHPHLLRRNRLSCGAVFTLTGHDTADVSECVGSARIWN